MDGTDFEVEVAGTDVEVGLAGTDLEVAVTVRGYTFAALVMDGTDD